MDVNHDGCWQVFALLFLLVSFSSGLDEVEGRHVDAVSGAEDFTILMVDHLYVRIGFFVPREHVHWRFIRLNFNFLALLFLGSSVLLSHLIVLKVRLPSVYFMAINVRD